MKVSVIGGGLSGLTAAWELSSDPDLEVELLESSDRLGGKIGATAFAGTVVDSGADAFLRRVPDALNLCTELGITELISPATSSAMVWIDDALHPLPAGLVLGVPVSFDELERSDLLTPWGLARARHEAELPPEPLTGDASIGDVISHRYGTEVTARLVGPLLGGINAGAIDEMSIDAVAPQLAAAARRPTSMTEALRPQLPGAGSSDRGPVFAAPVGGMSVLITTLIDALVSRGVTLRTGSDVRELTPGSAAVITTPAPTTARLLEPVAPDAAAVLRDIEFASVVFTTLAYRNEDVPDSVHALDVSGFLVPRDAGLTLTAVSILSTKWPHLGGEHTILRVSSGHSGDSAPIEMSDESLLEHLRRDLHTTLGIDAVPTETRITRYRDAFPQYAVGHLDRIAAVEADLLARAPHLAVCGMAHRGVGIPACVREARLAASSLRSRLDP